MGIFGVLADLAGSLVLVADLFVDDFDEGVWGFGGVLASVVLWEDVSLDEMLCAFGTVKLKLLDVFL